MSAEPTGLLTAEEVAAQLRMNPETFKRHAKAAGWPCVRFSRSTIRYRSEHVEQIVALYENEATPQAPAGITGQTKRSQARSA